MKVVMTISIPGYKKLNVPCESLSEAQAKFLEIARDVGAKQKPPTYGGPTATLLRKSDYEDKPYTSPEWVLVFGMRGGVNINWLKDS